MIPAINFKDTDLRDIVRSIAYEYQTNIVVDNRINNKISTALFNVRVADAVKMIAMDNGFEFSFDSTRFFIKVKKEVLPPSPPPHVEPEPEITYANGLLTILANNAEISKVVDKLRTATGKNFLLSAETSGRVAGALFNINLATGLKNLLYNNGFSLNMKDSIYYISRTAVFSGSDLSNNQSRPGGYWINAKNKKITLNISQASLDRTISDIAGQLDLHVVKLAIPNVNVTLKCSDLPVDKAFTYLFRGTDFTFKNDNGIYIIGKKDQKSLDNVKLVRIQYLRADKLKEMLPQTLMQSVGISVSIEHNALILTGTNEAVSTLEDYIETIDKPVPQVLIEALVVDYNLDNIYKMGVTAGRGDSLTLARTAGTYYPNLDLTLSGQKVNRLLNDIGQVNFLGKEINVAKLGKLPDDFYVNLSAMEQNGIANIKSKPQLSSLNGHTASLKIGTVQNYVFNEIMPIQNQLSSTYIQRERIEKIEANISFELTPWIGPNNELTLEIKPEFQTPVGQFVPDKRLIPAINTRSMVSTVRLRDGETIILGGLIQENETNTEDRVPILSDIPFIGGLFTNVNKKKTKGELIIYLTPKIFYGDESGYSYYDFSN